MTSFQKLKHKFPEDLVSRSNAINVRTGEAVKEGRIISEAGYGHRSTDEDLHF
jgi:hypothetical protein